MTLAENLPECLGAIFSCEDPTPRCRNSARFDFPTLWNITQQYRGQCPHGPWLFGPLGVVGAGPDGEVSLDNRTCEHIAGATWKRYSNADIWSRLTTWKFPLFQLISISPRPPLGFWTEAFTIVHLLGDPIGSTTDLVRKIDSCHNRVEHWKTEFKDDRLLPILQDHGGPYNLYRQRLWKALALIVVSYDEWGSTQGDSADDYLTEKLTNFCDAKALKDDPLKHDRELFITLCLKTAGHLAADRATNFLPVIVAQAIFIGSVAIAIIRTKSLSEGPNPQTYIDIEAYSIGFTALYFWVISTVMLTSVIGTSQTANSIPEILGAFHWKLSKEFSPPPSNLPETFVSEERYHRGGIYSWQPDGASKGFIKIAAARMQHLRTPTVPRERRRSSTTVILHRSWPWFCTALPTLSVSFGTIIGMVLTSLVPPDGWSCRSMAEMTILVVWLVSYVCTLYIGEHHPKNRFWLTFVKDFVAMAATLGLVIATQIGIFNKCSCYTRGGKVGLALPQTPTVKANLEHRLESQYPTIVVTSIVAQLLIFPGIILLRYYGAVRVFLQRDDGESHLQWYYNLGSETWWMTPLEVFNKWMKGKRKGGIGLAEEGGELGDVTTPLNKAASASQDEGDTSNGSTSRMEEVTPTCSPLESPQPARGRDYTISRAARTFEGASEAGRGRRKSIPEAT